jgi:hypothetical protein
MARLTSVHGAFEAHVLVARLRDEGLDVSMRGAVHNPYPLTVGELARIDLYVPVEQIDDASYVLLASEVEDALDDPPARRRAPASLRVLGALVLVAAISPALVPVLRGLGLD